MRVFEISTTNTNVVVHAGESCVLDFTVINKTDGNLNGLLRILPDNKSHLSWISTQGNSSYNFPPNGTQNLKVELTPPETAQAEKTQCRIILADEGNPDENFGDIMFPYEIRLPRKKERKGIWRVLNYITGRKSHESG